MNEMSRTWLVIGRTKPSYNISSVSCALAPQASNPRAFGPKARHHTLHLMDSHTYPFHGFFYSDSPSPRTLCQLNINVVADPLFLQFFMELWQNAHIYICLSVKCGICRAIWFTTKGTNRQKLSENTFILSTNWFVHSCLLLADGTDSKGFVLLFLLLIAERTDRLCPKFSPSSLSVSLFPGSFSNLRNWRQWDFCPKVLLHCLLI